MRAFEFSLPLQSSREGTQLVADPYERLEDSNGAPGVKCNVGFRRGGVRFSLSRREREHRTPRCDESRRSGLAKARRSILPLPKGEGRGEGEKSRPSRGPDP